MTMDEYDTATAELPYRIEEPVMVDLTTVIHAGRTTREGLPVFFMDDC